MATKTVYQTDLVSRVYLYPVEANELPWVPGFYNIPYGAYEDAPPDTTEGQVARRVVDGSQWELVQDHRSDVLYLVATGGRYDVGTVVDIDGEQLTYLGCGDLPAWLTLEAPAETEAGGVDPA